MAHLSIRQSGGANIVSLPKAVLNALDLHLGSKLAISVEEKKIVLTPVVPECSLEDLLEGSPIAKLTKTEEDEQWLNEKPIGKEI